MKQMLWFICLQATGIFSHAQQPPIASIRTFITENRGRLLTEFNRFLQLPNVAADTTGLRKNADYLVAQMKGMGIEQVQLLPAKTAGVAAAVYGEVKVAGATNTLLFYAHYDGQPVNAAQWKKGLSPFVPALFSKAIDAGGTPVENADYSSYNDEWRIYARGASDDKAGIYAILNAFDALQKTGKKLHSNIKFFFEGEEEAGSPHLDEIMEANSGLLQSDLLVICDGPVHQSGKKQVIFGARGDTRLDLTVYAAKRPLHSGHYGNWAPNPAMMLAKLLAGMKDDNGRVTIKDFYDDVTPLTALEQKALSEMPSVDEQMKGELGINKVEMTGINLSEAINLPSLNINGMQSGNVGKTASNQIPTSATAVLDLRLVKGNDWQRQQQKVIDHIKAQGYFVTGQPPTDEERATHDKIIQVLASKDGYNAQRTPMDLPIAKKLVAALATTTTDQIVLQPTMGGSLPLFLFEKYLGATCITVPIANHDNNQHAENENIRLGNLFEGMVSLAAVMMMK